VTHAFQAVFGWNRERAQKHMLEVHELGKSVLTKESFEQAEFTCTNFRNIPSRPRWNRRNEEKLKAQSSKLEIQTTPSLPKMPDKHPLLSFEF
jgi:hypothetical protein